MMTQKTTLTCIVCPVGCQLEVTRDGDNFNVTGNTCKRGPIYAEAELTHPTRVLTTTAAIKNGKLNRIPVFTDGEIPKGKIFETMEVINKLHLYAPVNMRDVIIENILSTGINVLASRSMEKK